MWEGGNVTGCRERGTQSNTGFGRCKSEIGMEYLSFFAQCLARREMHRGNRATRSSRRRHGKCTKEFGKTKNLGNFHELVDQTLIPYERRHAVAPVPCRKGHVTREWYGNYGLPMARKHN